MFPMALYSFPREEVVVAAAKRKYKGEHSNIIEEKNIKGGSGGPKLKKKIEKNGGSMGGVHGGIQGGSRGVMVEQIFSKK